MNRNHKLINGRPKEIKYIPLATSGGITNPNEQQLIDFGCKEWIRPEPQPNCEEVFTENETQIISTWVKLPIVQPIWHEQTNFQIKFTERNLRYMLGRDPYMAFYTQTLEDYEDLMGNVYFYVNRINDEELSLLKQYAEIFDKKGNLL
jgi:hypothetical protein